MALSRVLHLNLYDYSGNKLCPLYDSYSSAPGDAVNVIIQDERNGWRELYFDLPTVVQTQYGTIDNFRIDFLKAEYLIEAIEEKGTDWFFISQPKIIHNAFSKTLSVTSPHISQWLKYKNLGLEFSDNEGNNVGTAKELLATILEGTGWEVGDVYNFAEKDGSTKYRSLKASSKTGAFKLITTMCELFDARPVFHGDTRKVDIVPLNPFSEAEPGEIQKYAEKNGVLELHYGSALKNITRLVNTENIVTKLYAYGAYGDKTSGYCAIDECTHNEYTFTTNSALESGHEYFFEVNDTAGKPVNYSFTVTENLEAGTVFIFSQLDPCSMSYIWRDTVLEGEEHGKAYFVKKGKSGEALDAEITSEPEVPNWFGFLLDFDYYIEVGLFSDDMLQKVALYQREAPQYYKAISEASKTMSDAVTELSKTAGVFPYARLAVKRKEPLLGDGYLTLVLDYENYDQGVLYRSDFDSNVDTRFKWIVTDELMPNGDPVNSGCSRLYIVHPADTGKPMTWDVLCLKKVMDDLVNPKAIVLWADKDEIEIDVSRDKFYLMQSLSTAGYLGYLEARDEAIMQALEDTTTIATNTHEVVFTDKSPNSIAPPTSGSNDDLPFPSPRTNSYGWLWRYYPIKNEEGKYRESDFYFCNTSYDGNEWKKVHFSDTMPTDASIQYWYNWRKNTLSRAEFNTETQDLNWNILTGYTDEKIASYFGTVYYFGKARDRVYQGVNRKQIYELDVNETLPAGNYYFEDGYGSYWVFTIKAPLTGPNASLSYDVYDNWLTINRDGITESIKGKSYRFDSVKYHPDNIIKSLANTQGYISEKNGDIETSYNITKYENCCYTNGFTQVYPDTKYTLSEVPSNSYIHFYNDKKRWIGMKQITDNTFETSADCFYIRFSAVIYKNSEDQTSLFNLDNLVITVTQPFGSYTGTYDNTIVISDMTYLKLDVNKREGEVIGLMDAMEKFTTGSDHVYQELYVQLKEAQDAVKDLENRMTSSVGDIYREGYWQDASYVDGDEKRLYDDAIENIEEISKPDITYSIGFLDPYSSNEENMDYGASEESIKVPYTDVDISTAVHLVDPELNINCWAYIDKLRKCYDKPWQDTIEVNTKLSTIGQHSFTDVMANIADVASEMKGKSSKYDNAANKAIAGVAVNIVSPNISVTEQSLSSIYQRIENIDNKIITHETSITQNADEISSEARRSIESEAELSTKITQTADDIKTELFGVNGDGKIIQSSEEFSTTYQNNYNYKVNKELIETAQDLNEKRVASILNDAKTINDKRIYKLKDRAIELNLSRDEEGKLSEKDSKELIDILNQFNAFGLIDSSLLTIQVPVVVEEPGTDETGESGSGEGTGTGDNPGDEEPVPEEPEPVPEDPDPSGGSDEQDPSEDDPAPIEIRQLNIEEAVEYKDVVTAVLDSIDENVWLDVSDEGLLIARLEQLKTAGLIDESVDLTQLAKVMNDVTNAIKDISNDAFEDPLKRAELIDTLTQLKDAKVISDEVVIEDIVDSKEAVVSVLNKIPVSEYEYLMSSMKQTMYGLYLNIYGTDAEGHIITTADEFRSVFESADGDQRTKMTQTIYGMTNIVESSNGMTMIDQDDRSISAIVRGINSDPNGKNNFNTSAISISDKSINVSSTGEINITAGGAFTVDTENFDLTKDGRLTTNEAVLTNAKIYGDIYKNGFPVIALGEDIIVSQTQPEGVYGRIWIKPNPNSGSGSGSGSGSETVTTKTGTVKYTGSYSFGIRSYDNLNTLNVTLSGTGFASNSTNCTYNVRFDFFMPSSEGKKTPGGGKLIVTLAGAISEETELYTGAGSKSVNLTFNSSKWIGTGSTMNFRVGVSGVRGYNGTFLNNAFSSNITVTCTAK